MSTIPQGQTKVVGYFNPNRWPVIVNISAVNVNLNIGPKCYVLHSGQKVNDPLLERFVGADMLARESGKELVNYVLFTRPVLSSQANVGAVGASSSVNKNSRGIVQESSFDGVIARHTGEPSTSSSSTSSVRSYSVQEAVRQHIIKPVIVPDDSRAPVETAGQPGRLDNVPPIMHARDATPGEARRMAEQGVTSVELPVNQIIETRGGTQEEEEHTEVEGMGDLKPVNVAEEMQRLAGLSLDSTPAPTVTPLPQVIETPAPKVKEVVPPAIPSILGKTRRGSSTRPDAFVCAVDGKSFAKKSKLASHIKENYPDQLDKLLAPYSNLTEDGTDAGTKV